MTKKDPNQNKPTVESVETELETEFNADTDGPSDKTMADLNALSADDQAEVIDEFRTNIS